MPRRASRWLRWILGAVTVAVAVLAPIAYLSDYSITLSFRWTRSDDADPVIWIGCSSYRGELTFWSNIAGKLLLDAFARGWVQHAFIGRRFVFQAARAGLDPIAWWFQARSLTLAIPLPVPPGTAHTNGPPQTYPFRENIFAIPYWILFLLCAPYPLSALINLPGRRRRKRFAEGMCVHCGYDLRHSPDRCPECGSTRTAAPPPSRTAGSLLDTLRRKIWLRICLYPVFFAVFCFAFTEIYWWHFQK